VYTYRGDVIAWSEAEASGWAAVHVGHMIHDAGAAYTSLAPPPGDYSPDLHPIVTKWLATLAARVSYEVAPEHGEDIVDGRFHPDELSALARTATSANAAFPETVLDAFFESHEWRAKHFENGAPERVAAIPIARALVDLAIRAVHEGEKADLDFLRRIKQEMPVATDRPGKPNLPTCRRVFVLFDAFLKRWRQGEPFFVLTCFASLRDDLAKLDPKWRGLDLEHLQHVLEGDDLAEIRVKKSREFIESVKGPQSPPPEPFRSVGYAEGFLRERERWGAAQLAARLACAVGAHGFGPHDPKDFAKAARAFGRGFVKGAKPSRGER
jgi:hypothetical protein